MDVPPNKVLHCLKEHKRDMTADDEYVTVIIVPLYIFYYQIFLHHYLLFILISFFDRLIRCRKLVFTRQKNALKGLFGL